MMSAEVKRLAEVKPTVDEDSVAFLEEVLEEAKRGEIREVLIIGVERDGKIASWANFKDSEPIIAYIERLKYRMLKVTTD